MMQDQRNIKLRRRNRYRIDIIAADVTRKHVQDSNGIARQCSKISNAEMFQKIGASQNRKRRMLISDERQGITSEIRDISGGGKTG
jgi:hypothetical protein